MGKRAVTVSMLIVIVAIVALAGSAYLFLDGQGKPETGGDGTSEPGLPTDANGTAGTPRENYPEPEETPFVFTHPPLAEVEYIEISPLGSLNPPGHTFPTDHIYFYLTDPGVFPPPYQVKIPGDGVITEVIYSRYDWPGGSGHTGQYNDYSITIRHTDTFESRLGHVSELEDWLSEKLGPLEPGWSRVEPPISVSAGEVVGRAGGRAGAQAALDMWARDETVNLSFIHPEKYGFGEHAVSPLDYFEKDLRESLYLKVRRTAEPRGGKIDFDRLGKLVGNWFFEDITDPLREWDKHLTFVYDWDDPSQIRISVGGTLSMPVGVYQVEGNYPDPAEVSAESGMVVYRLMGTTNWQGETATILAQVVDSERIKVEAFEGYPPNLEFTNNALHYTR